MIDFRIEKFNKSKDMLRKVSISLNANTENIVNISIMPNN